ncbi:CBS domain-containing protein [Candidatus Woesearchaeota archaeon]|nr:CBS domain-containing protein [Candidatus Woesearchaeota archaeon]
MTKTNGKPFPMKIKDLMYFIDENDRDFSREIGGKNLVNPYLEAFMKEFSYEVPGETAYQPRLSLTFDDIALMDLESDIRPDQVNVQSWFSRNVPVNTPVISAAMDTVTEYGMAIAMAMCGGLGVVHKGGNMTPKEQARHVAGVKHYLHGMINKPKFFQETDTVEYLKKRVTEKGWKFTSFPVLDAERKVKGIITGTKLTFINKYDPSAKLEDVMRKEPFITDTADIDEVYKEMRSREIKSVPVVDDNGVLRGLYVWEDVERIVEGKSRIYNVDTDGMLRCAAAISPTLTEEEKQRIDLLVKEGIDVLVLDTSHANSREAVEAVKYIKETYKDSTDVVAGNLAYPAMVPALIEAGVDGLKFGVGPGSICTTRTVSGVGVPQATVSHMANLMIQNGVPYNIDGGLTKGADLSKAIAFGASTVMLGNKLAGTDESPGRVVNIGDGKFVVYRGMASVESLLAGKGAGQRYFMSEDTGDTGNIDIANIVSQGDSGLVPYEGSVSSVVYKLVQGLRIGMAHTGARDIYEFQNKARATMITDSGNNESNVHDLMRTQVTTAK